MPGARSDKTREWPAFGGPAIILVEPQMGENIGAAARAMGNFGLTDLRLVRPRDGWPNLQAVRSASGADRVIEGFGHKIPLADGAVEMAFTCGVLIHVDPSLLERTVREIHRASSKYVFCAEYFSPKAETIQYRGETDLLFKNDFGSLYLDLFPDLRLVDYGFFWRRTTVMDDCTWWLFRKA